MADSMHASMRTVWRPKCRKETGLHRVICVRLNISSVESQKGVIAAQRCSVENQKGRYRYTKSMAIAPFWFSTEHRWCAITPFWLSTDDIFDMYYGVNCPFKLYFTYANGQVVIKTTSTLAITVEPRYNEVVGTIKITLLYQVSHYIRVKQQRNIKSWDQAKLPSYNRVLLYPTSL